MHTRPSQVLACEAQHPFRALLLNAHHVLSAPEQKSVSEDCVVVGDENNLNFEFLKQDAADFIFDSLLDVDAWT